MSETRPSLSIEEFERAAVSRAPNWWAVGETFAYAPEVRAVEGWNKPDSPGNLMLTPAQRDLLVWIEIVREAATSCISDFFHEKRILAEKAEGVVERMGWPDFQRIYTAAARAYMIVDGNSVSAKTWRQEELDHWERLRKEVRTLQRARGSKPDTGEDLDRAVMRRQLSGRATLEPRRRYPELDDFNAWFHQEETMIESERYVGDFIRRKRDELAIIVG